MKKLSSFLTLFFVCTFADFTTAAEVLTQSAAQISDRCGAERTILLHGQIDKGDVERLRAALGPKLSEAPTSDFRGSQARLVLDSPGGNLVEGIALANLVRDAALRTYVRSNAQCVSACALVFMAGTSIGANGKRFSIREIEPGAKLAFHAPDLPEEMLRDIAPDDRVAARAIEEAMFQAARGFVNLLHDHNWAQSLTEFTLEAVDKGEFVEVKTVDQAGRWRIGIAGSRRLRIEPNLRDESYYAADAGSPLGLHSFCVNSEEWAKDQFAFPVLDTPSPLAANIQDRSILSRPIIAYTRARRYREHLFSHETIGGYESYCVVSTDQSGRIYSAFWPGDLTVRSGLPNIDNQGVALIPVDRIRAWQALPPDTPITRIDESLADTGIFRSVGPEQDVEPFVVESQTTNWNHNGSKMELRVEKLDTGQTDVTISYSQPRESLLKYGIEPKQLLFKGQLVEGSLSGRAFVFRRGCDPIPYGVTGRFDPSQSAFRLTGAAPDQTGDRCQPEGKTFDSSAAALVFDHDGIAEYERDVQTKKIVLACPAAPSD
ncbi:ATP-dependent Clp protease proteolytic subunit [Jiella sonneratiae]|uniref:ATP-dependent Clp protease proteolytic subunit n=1 Tax=Jiella sonneratiae TaxID=2816856 RepID=A0ABS3J4K8_9HYPH|nr:ATP-dependent Clp protease proteolytic subunit [Jiella sonneratiae]MBO0904620.1 ATP-dependent Clp protease proteolytic subunit [Jiella sonneratiae]